MTDDRKMSERGFPAGGVFSAALDAVVVMDVQGEIVDWNPAAEKTFGYSHAEAVGRDLAELIVPPSLRGRHRHAFARYLATGESTILDRRLELSAMRRDGELFPVELTVTRVPSAEPPVFAGFIRDIGELKRAVSGMEEAKTSFEVAFEHAPIGVAHVSLDERDLGRLLLVNSAFCRLIDRDREQLLGMTVADLTHPDDVERNLDEARRMAAGDLDTYETDKQLVRPDGRTVVTSFSASVVRERDGEVRYGIVHVQDITARRMAEAEIAEREQRFRTAFSTALDAMVIIDDERNLVACNRAAAELMGIRSEEIADSRMDDFVPENAEAVDAIWRKFLAAGEWRSEFELQRAGGGVRQVEVSARASFTAGRHLAIMRDVTDRKRSEGEAERLKAALHEAQKLETVGLLAGGVAHDFNNLLAVILHSSEYALGELGDHPAAAEVREIRAAADRAASLTRQLLAFSSRDVARPRRLDMNEFVKGLDWLLRRAVGQRIRLETDLPPDLPEAHADPDLLEQVLLNLAMNARDAMSDGGVLRVRTRVEAIDEIRAREQADVAAGSYLRLELIDDGTGMPELVRRRAFEPFFTTKPKGAGTGLGLATTYGIVKQMGGFVEIDSEVGHGTVMKVYLPVAGHVAEEPAATAVGGDERILLVEDEEGVRRITARILTESGYTVLSAAHPREALAILGEGPVDLVLTDVVMPGMSGGMLVARMREDTPRLRAVFMSGYTDRPDALPRDAEFIAKPFTRQALLERVALARATG
ncbi:MAG: hypothetical protein QOC95_809 [Thermoleophilaceae bacterium]|nr:hypothetical protein [Thermoleophilaceae bacterium]